MRKGGACKIGLKARLLRLVVPTEQLREVFLLLKDTGPCVLHVYSKPHTLGDKRLGLVRRSLAHPIHVTLPRVTLLHRSSIWRTNESGMTGAVKKCERSKVPLAHAALRA
jgi:hypothetical protein